MQLPLCKILPISSLSIWTFCSFQESDAKLQHGINHNSFSFSPWKGEFHRISLKLVKSRTGRHQMWIYKQPWLVPSSVNSGIIGFQMLILNVHPVALLQSGQISGQVMSEGLILSLGIKIINIFQVLQVNICIKIKNLTHWRNSPALPFQS